MPSKTSAAGDTIRLLLQEDDANDAKLLLRELERAGFKVQSEVAADSIAFMERVQGGTFDLIVTDYNLPDWTGLDAIRWLRARDQVTPLILVTATLGDEQAAECMKEGATDYVLKDRLSRLPRAVRRALDEARVRAEHDRAVKELYDSEQQYRLLFGANPNPMWVYDVETMKFLAVNDAAVQRYGYSEQEFLSMTIGDIRPAEDLAAFMREYETWDKITDIDFEVYRHRRKNGTPFEVQVSSRPITFKNRKARLVLGFDVTARLEAERAHRESEAQFKSLVQGSPYGVYRVNEEGRLLMVNPALVKMLGYESEAEVLRLNTATEVYSTTAERERALLAHQKSEYVSGFETKWKRKDDEEIFVRLAGRKINVDAGSRIYEVFAQDITEEKTLEQQFRQAQKMEAVGRLAGGVAHDVNNMLMIIGSYAQLLEDVKGDPEKTRRYTGQIRDAVHKTASITRQLLAFSRKQVMETSDIDLNVVVADLVKMLPRLLGEDVDLIFEPGAALGSVSADRGQLEQVIMNLAVNARDAMPKGGRLIIETTNVELDDGYGHSHGLVVKPGDYVLLAVSDSGVGMDAETQARIFEPFFTTKEMGKGTGLGLATVYGIVKQSEGFIWVYSELGKGTTFKVYLPRVKSKQEKATPAPEVVAVPTGTETILLVEDEAALRVATAEYLRSKGYKVVEAEQGQRALEILQQERRGTIHLLLTDVVMPGMSGPDLGEAALRIHPELRMIYASGYTDRSISQEISGSRAVFLQKPFSLDILARRIRQLMGDEVG